ncbi:VCBS domain-containing protein, partial [Sneathiella aquimaris]
DAGDVLTETFTVMTADGTTQDITVTINGTEDAAEISGTDTGSVTEDASLTTSGKLNVSDADAGESSFQAGSQNGAHGTLSIDAAGNWTYVGTDSAAIQALDAGDVLTETFTVMTADGTEHTVQVNINGADEAPVVEVPQQTEEELLSDAAVEFGGPQNFGRGAELNGMDSFTISATFELDTLSGGTQSLVWNTQQYGLILSGDNLYVYLRDTGGRMDVAVVADAFDQTGWHDVQVVLDKAAGSLNVYVDGAVAYTGSSDAIALTNAPSSDVFAGQTEWGHPLQGQLADVSIVGEAMDVDGSQTTYERMYAMDEGDLASQLAAVAPTPDPEPEPTPENTAAEISGDTAARVAEDGTLATSGKLNVTDIDAGESNFQAGTLAGAYGALVISADGSWSYAANDSAQIQALDVGDTLTDTFTVQSADGTEQTVTITIDGAEDAAVISGTDTGSVTEDASMSTSGKLNVSDADQGESFFQADELTGDYGSFSIDTNGNWNYTATDSAQLQALNTGDNVTENFTVLSADGTQHTVDVTVNGADEVVVTPPTGGGGGLEIEVGSIAELVAAMENAVGGETIKLRPGDYEPFTLDGFVFPENVTLTSADPNNPAHLENLILKNSTNITFENLTFHSEDAPYGSWGEFLFTVTHSSNIDIKNNHFGNDSPTAHADNFIGLTVKNSDGIDVTDNEFTNLGNGAGFSYTQNLNVSDNYVHNVRSDGFDFTSVQHVEVIGNTIKDLYPTGGDHSDNIQFTGNRNMPPNTDIVIRDNVIVQGDGNPGQGIFMKTDPESPFQNVVIENNIVYQSAYHGITVYNADGLTINQNTVVSPPDTQLPVWIKVFDVQNTVVENNITNTMAVVGDDSSVEFINNILTETSNATGLLPYSEVFANELVRLTSDVDGFLVNSEFSAGAEVAVFLANDEPLAGNTTNNDIRGTEEADIIYGFSGEDTLNGEGGDDTLYGGNGDDQLIGGSGDDVLVGGNGADILVGGEGQDLFLFSDRKQSAPGEQNRDSIQDFNATGEDKISLEGLISGEFDFIGSAEFSAPASTESVDAQLTNIAGDFGAGVVNLGYGDQFFGMTDLTVSATFELNSLSGGKQAVVFNHKQYAIKVVNDDMQIMMRKVDGTQDTINIGNVLGETGWHDTQLVLDSGAGTLELWLDGAVVYSGSSAGYQIGEDASLDLTAGGLLWGEELDGQVADVTILDKVIDFSAENTVLDRMYMIDEYDEFIAIDRTTGNGQARFDEETQMLSIDLDGDLEADMEMELVGVSLQDLDNSDFLI